MRDFVDRATPFSAAERQASRDLWTRLRVENAAVRVIGDNTVVSTALTHYDEAQPPT